MSKIKRGLFTVLAAILTLSLVLTLAGCAGKATPGQTDGSTQAASGTQTTTAEPTPTPLPETELIWYFPFTPQPDQDKVFAEFNKLLKPKLNATIDFKAIDWAAWDNKMKVVLSAGDPWDITFSCHWQAGSNYKQSVAGGLFEPLDELMAKYAPTLAAYPSKYYDTLRVNGKFYGVFGMQCEVRQSGWWFRKDLVEKYSLGDIINNARTTRDLEPAFEAIKNGEPEMFIMEDSLNDFIASDGKQYVGVFDAYCVALDDPSLTIVNAEEKFLLEATKMKKGWNDKGYFKKDAVAVKDWFSLRKAGKVFCGNAWTIKPGQEIEMKNNNNGLEFIVKPISQCVVDTGGPMGNCHAISANSKNKERAMMFLELINSDKELFNLLVYGIENEHYKKLDADYVEVVPNSKYVNAAWEFGNQFNAYLIKGQAPDTYELTQKMNESALPNPVMGFSFDVEPVKNEQAKVAAIWEQYKEALSYGITKDPEKTVKEYFEKKDAAGWQTLLKEVEKQFNAWKATNGK